MEKNVRGSTLGLISLGSIGLEVAFWENIFDTRSPSTQRNQLSLELEEDFSSSFCSIEKVFQVTYFISTNMPLNNENRGMIGEKLLKLMRPHAIIVIIARADIINRDAILSRLET